MITTWHSYHGSHQGEPRVLIYDDGEWVSER